MHMPSARCWRNADRSWPMPKIARSPVDVLQVSWGDPSLEEGTRGGSPPGPRPKKLQRADFKGSLKE
jgi:hypothetical protein